MTEPKKKIKKKYARADVSSPYASPELSPRGTPVKDRARLRKLEKEYEIFPSGKEINRLKKKGGHR